MTSEFNKFSALDLHRLQAALLNNCLYRDVTAQQRQHAKAMTHHLLYTPGATVHFKPEHFQKVFTAEELAGHDVEKLAETYNRRMNRR